MPLPSREVATKGLPTLLQIAEAVSEQTCPNHHTNLNVRIADDHVF